MRSFLTVSFLLCLLGGVCSFAVPASATSMKPQSEAASTNLNAGLSDFVPAAASLFNNMKTPASIIGGAMIPVGFMGPINYDPEEGDGKFAIFLRRIYPFMSVLTFTSELLSVMWATMAVNQLTENKIEAATSVWALIQRDFSLHWAATNAHFVLGMLGFIWVIMSRAYFMVAKGSMGLSLAGCAFSGFLLAISIVNRTMQTTTISDSSAGFGCTILSLIRVYSSLLLKRAFSSKSFGVLEVAAVGIAIASMGNALRLIISEVSNDKK